MRRILMPLIAAAALLAAQISHAAPASEQKPSADCRAQQRSCIVKCGGSNDCIKNCEASGQMCAKGTRP
ncbi:MAG: hypothetical protein ACKVSF_15010 [Alphaproteobacteria bacterium]